MSKITVGLTEPVVIYGKKMKVRTTAKFDTGAQRTSIDSRIAEKIGLGTVIKFVRIKSASSGASNYVRRPVFRADIVIMDKKFPIEVNIADRSHLKQKVLIGRDVMFNRFIVDITKSHHSHQEHDVKEGRI